MDSKNHATYSKSTANETMKKAQLESIFHKIFQSTMANK